jgi:sugar phosphate permease
VVVLAFCAALVGAGTRSAPTVFIHAFELEFGWSRAAIAGAISVNLLLFGLGAPVSGRLIDRFGLRPVVTGNLILLTLATLASTQITSLWQLSILWGVVIGIAAGGGAVLSATVASRWFVARRGLVVGILGTATSTGQVTFIPLLMWITVSFGWRGATLALALVAASLVIPVFLLMRNEPAEIGQKPFGADDPVAQARVRQGDSEPAISLTGAMQSRDFWLLAGSFFVCGATSNGLIGTHLIPYSIDHGIPEVTAAATVGVMGFMNFIGTTGSGYLSDKYDPRKLLAFYYTFRGLSLFVLPFVTWFPGLLVFAVLYGLDWLATVPPTTTLAAQRFGRKSIGTIYGWIFFCHQIGAALASFGAGAVRDYLSDYQMAFLAGGILCLVGASLALMVRRRRPSAGPAVAGASAA